MFIDRILFPVSTLGPGQRVVVWTSGCSKRCPGCANQELWETNKSQEMPVEQAARVLEALSINRGAHRLTLTGGDPLEQCGEVARMLESVRDLYDDVLLYTGFTLAEARTILGGDMARVERVVDAVIDGRYVKKLNDGIAPLRGSTNQEIHIITPRLEQEYRLYMREGRCVQNYVFNGKAISVGIHGEATRHDE